MCGNEKEKKKIITIFVTLAITAEMANFFASAVLSIRQRAICVVFSLLAARKLSS
jgi:hypothetical protein